MMYDLKALYEAESVEHAVADASSPAESFSDDPHPARSRAAVIVSVTIMLVTFFSFIFYLP